MSVMCEAAGRDASYLEIIKNNPGCTASELSRIANEDALTARNRVINLEMLKMVTRDEHRYYIPGDIPWPHPKPQHCRNIAQAAKIMHYLFDESTGSCAKIFDYSVSSMRRIVRGLQQDIDQSYCPVGMIRMAYLRKDRREILHYIAENGPVSTFDVQLCCNHGKSAVLGHLKALHGQGKIRKVGQKYEEIHSRKPKSRSP